MSGVAGPRPGPPRPDAVRSSVAVVAPFHDAEGHVAGWLRQLAEQSEPDFHLYLVDDASSDGTATALRAGVAEHGLSADLLVLPRNAGPAAARNAAIRAALAAGARLVLLLDSDCRVAPDWIERHLAFHAHHPDMHIMGGAIAGVASTAVGRADGFCSWFTAIPRTPSGPVRRLHLSSTNMSIKHEVFARAGFFDETLATGEDVAFCRAAQASGMTLWFESDIVVTHLDRESWPEARRHHYRWGLHSYALSQKAHGGYYDLLTRLGSRRAVAALVPVIAALNVALILWRYTRTQPRVWLSLPWIAALRWWNAVGVYHGFVDPARALPQPAPAVSGDGFQGVQDRYFAEADRERFAWTTLDRGFAPVEDALLTPWLEELRFPCLEVGCGEGTNLARLARRGRPVGIDRYPAKARFAAHAVPEARIAAADALALPFADGTFDGVLVRDLLHHLADRRRAAAEAVRVLRPGGTLLVLEPNGRNPFIALQARLVRAERALREFAPASVLDALAGLPLDEVSVSMAQAFPVRRAILHYRFGCPRLGRCGASSAVLAFLERLGERLLPRARWAYTVVRARRR